MHSWDIEVNERSQQWSCCFYIYYNAMDKKKKTNNTTDFETLSIVVFMIEHVNYNDQSQQMSTTQ